MNPVERLKSVLCDPEGRCCIAGSEEDRRIVDEALRSLSLPSATGDIGPGDGVSAGRFHCACVFNRATDFSEATLVSACAYHSAAPAAQQEPVAWITEGGLEWMKKPETERSGPGLVMPTKHKQYNIPLYAAPSPRVEAAAIRNAALEEAARAIEPGYPRGCDCEHCDCGNSGDAMRVAQWDSDTASAGMIRALRHDGDSQP